MPVEALNPYYKDINSYTDLPILLREQIAAFLHHYKDLEIGKWVKIIRWVGPDEAAELDHGGARARSGLNASAGIFCELK